VRISIAGEIPADAEMLEAVEPSTYACVVSENAVAPTTNANAIGRAFSCTRRTSRSAERRRAAAAAGVEPPGRRASGLSG
jgi:hypothetical protein